MTCLQHADLPEAGAPPSVPDQAVQRAGQLAAAGQPAAAASAGSKLRRARNVKRLVDVESRRGYGSAALIGDGAWLDLFLASPSLYEILRNTVDEQILGSPIEPKTEP